MIGRRRVGVVAVATALAAGLLPAREARGGPVEAREGWKRASALRAAPWRQRLAALREARREAGPNDPLLARVLVAEGGVLRAAGLGGAAAAAESFAADTGPARDPSRLARALAAARDFEEEGDVVAALDRLSDVLGGGAGGAPEVLGPALVLRARIAAERDDEPTLVELRRAADGLPWDRVADRLAVVDLFGQVRLRAGDRPAALRALDAEKRLYAEATRRGDFIARLASRAWLRLLLPRLLDASPR